ncbi:GNAT family N-acetyltransferase [Sediminibacillus albus]|uniref:Predicted acetyltransferase n=1 Tax=Sediminibacillus albus TaxID=407036 RepID=A0A1G8YC37_9BACI|nr:GNAT family N-acetyltransferase [Sediminibacillus albus]SDJ99974.1 Predicted acetyltransferase [Sediminibacillus albus]
MGEIKILKEEDFEEVFALSQFAFQVEMGADELAARTEETKRHKIFGWMEGEQLAAKLHIHPLACYIGGKPFEMGGIGAVATWPEYRRQGLVKKLLSQALSDMKQHGQTLSFLHPFSFPFYRKYGWELCFANRHYSIPIEKLSIDWGGQGYVKRVQNDVQLLHSIYSRFAKQYNGMLVRDEKWWQQRVLTGKVQTAIAYDHLQQADGYVIYHVKNNIFTVEELAYNSLNGWKVLMQFIANHDSMAEKVEMAVPEDDQLPLFIEEPRFLQEIKPYFMARIVDLPRFLNEYPFMETENKLLLQVEDAFLPENSGVFQLTDNGFVRKPLNPEQPGVFCSIQQLTSMLLGYKRPLALHNAGLITGERREVELLEAVIPDRQPFLSDFF